MGSCAPARADSASRGVRRNRRAHGSRIIARVNVVEHALSAYLQTEAGACDGTATSFNALPLYNGWWGTVYLTTAGEFLFRDEEIDPPQIRPEDDEHLQLASLVAGANRFPILANLFPDRPLTDEGCKLCEGTGRFYPRNATGWLYCPECHGLGWHGRIRAPLRLQDLAIDEAKYVSFGEAVSAFERFLQEEGVAGRLLFVRRADITILGRRVFVWRDESGTSYAEAAHDYEAAMRRRLGVGLALACRLPQGELVAYVYAPTNMDEALRLMYPDGVKYSVPIKLREGSEVGRWRAKVLAFVRRHVTAVRETQEFLK